MSLRADKFFFLIEIRYAPGGDEKSTSVFIECNVKLIIEIRYAPGGDEKLESI